MDEAEPREQTTLKAALDERRALMQKYVPAETQRLHRRVVEELRSRRFAVPAVGSAAPVFELADHGGAKVSLASLLRSGPAVLLFFRGRWCPFCVAQLESWNALVPDLSRAGIALAAISPQTQHQSFLMHDQHHLQFPLLSDAENRVARAYGLLYKVPEDQQATYRRTFVNLAFVNGDESWELPIPATFAIDRGGAVLFASADADYTVRPEPAEVLNSISASRSDRP